MQSQRTAQHMGVLAIIAIACLTVLQPFAPSAWAGPPSSYEKADTRALETPASATTSLDSLSNHLTSWTSNPFEKARAIFRWVAANIAYDTRSYFAGSSGATSAEAVLRTRLSVCMGYSSLFAELSRRAGLDVAVVDGCVKGYSYQVGGDLRGLRHQWNAFRVGTKWYLVECTWAAGLLDGASFRPRFTSAYFCPEPRDFAYDHYPDDPKWQLQKRPISLADFSQSAFVRTPYLEYGLASAPLSAGQLVWKGGGVLKVTAPEGVEVMAHASTKEGQPLDSRYALTTGSKGDWVARFAFDKPGVYVVSLYARRKASGGAFEDAVDFQVTVTKGLGERGLLPTSYGVVVSRGIELAQPLTWALERGKVARFRATVPGAKEVCVVESCSGRWTRLGQSGKAFSGSIAPGQGELRLVASFSELDTQTYEIIATYMVQ